MTENPPYNAGNRALIPGRGTEVPPTAGQLKQQVTTGELVRQNVAAETKTRHSQTSAELVRQNVAAETKTRHSQTSA